MHACGHIQKTGRQSTATGGMDRRTKNQRYQNKNTTQLCETATNIPKEQPVSEIKTNREHTARTGNARKTPELQNAESQTIWEKLGYAIKITASNTHRNKTGSAKVTHAGKQEKNQAV